MIHDIGKQRKIMLAHALAWASLLTVSGCGDGDPASSIKLTRISGTVMFNGKPLDRAQITFLPQDNSGKDTSTGSDVTGEDGAFSAKYRNRLGLAAGKYKVLITKTDTSGAASSLGDDPYMANLAKGGTGATVGTPTGLPAEYGDPAKTPLTLEVVAGQSQTDLVFEVKGTASKPGDTKKAASGS